MNNVSTNPLSKYDALKQTSPKTIAILLLSHIFICKEIFTPIKLITTPNEVEETTLHACYSIYRHVLSNTFCQNISAFISETKAIKVLQEALINYPEKQMYPNLADIIINTFIYNYRAFYNKPQSTKEYKIVPELFFECSNSIQKKLFGLFMPQKFNIEINFDQETEADITNKIKELAKENNIKIHKERPFTSKDIKHFLNNKSLQLCYIFIKNYQKEKISYPFIYKELGLPYYLNPEKNKSDTIIRKNYIPTLNWLFSNIEIKKLLKFSELLK